MNNIRNKIGKKIIIKGEMLHHVGFRPCLLSKALKLRIKNFEAENDDDDGKQVMVLLIGDTNQISEFINYIKIKKLPLPDTTKVIDVSEEEIDVTTTLDIADIDEYRKWLGVEQDNNIVQGGLQISDKIDNLIIGQENLRTETNENFGKMDVKYEAISKGMFAIAEAIDKRLEKLEERNEVVDTRMEKTDKNIESLLNILIQQKK